MPFDSKGKQYLSFETDKNKYLYYPKEGTLVINDKNTHSEVAISSHELSKAIDCPAIRMAISNITYLSAAMRANE
ncbi:Hypothetical protein LUCI_4920 [Lucifera butyrica]|uniref:Uncharacterized protein n=1 Tax=Lucifera butyrica TaxID=1351585 RepID=A0A498RF41_9FIRM|nr:hypothetical protein [Lucifera butyrica]VBB09625.1 Hypothetical protein LUCI_4920 [Lucifera butyrica]